MPNHLENKIEAIESQLDAVVDNGSDDELFVASYLRGHFDLVACKLLALPQADTEALDDNIRSSLQRAFTQGELELHDQQKVASLWEALIAS
ncbi:YfcL family protein [Alteromonas sp. ASW11-130]|uniref:YfcL family protein n=1 Tax=Alteromonas sp. ASW11-130 TaxID=3015775 RepID=UPI002241BDFC|nr:YfcL family protein [Alteromonas sp. ASW11-130]MCW8092576.1 YfcL family protein [Alteromonas sp. ASW11-130]